MLTFEELAKANSDRCHCWHLGGVDDWSPTDWACAAAGEMGEACNVIKKLRRLDGLGTLDRGYDHEAAGQLLKAAATEIGDTVVYLDLLAQRLGISLEDAVRDTFNRISDRESMPQRL